MRGGLSFDIAHLLAGLLVLVSFLELYQDRLYALLNMFALHALVLALSVAWQAHIQDAPHLYVTAAIALVFKAIVIPVALHRIIVRLGIHREIETVVGVGPAMLLGMGLVALSMVVMLRVTADADPLAREDLAFALSVVLLGLLMMVTRRNAVSQVVGFMSLENGLVLAGTGNDLRCRHCRPHHPGRGGGAARGAAGLPADRAAQRARGAADLFCRVL